MFIYITSVFCCILLACVADKLNKKAEVLPFAIVFLILFTISGFRYGVGTDYFLHMFQLINRYIMAHLHQRSQYFYGLTSYALILQVVGISLYLLLQALYS